MIPDLNSIITSIDDAQERLRSVERGKNHTPSQRDQALADIATDLAHLARDVATVAGVSLTGTVPDLSIRNNVPMGAED